MTLTSQSWALKVARPKQCPDQIPYPQGEAKGDWVCDLGGRKIWYDAIVGRLNVEERGQYLGEFDTEDAIMVIYKDGSYELTNFELTNRYDPAKVLIMEMFKPETVITAVHYDGKSKEYYVKRFQIETTTLDKSFSFISDAPNSKLAVVCLPLGILTSPIKQLPERKSKKKRLP